MFKFLFIFFVSMFSPLSHAVDSTMLVCGSNPCGGGGSGLTTGTQYATSYFYFVCNRGLWAGDGVNPARPGTLVLVNPAAGYYSCNLNDTGNPIFNASSKANTCPSGSTASANGMQCTCTPPNVDSADHLSCVAPPPSSCPSAGEPVGDSGYIDVGTSPLSMPPRACDSGCPSQYVGTGVEQSRLVDGVKHYYVKGGYVAKAGTCTEGATTFPREPALNADGCSSTQSSITMGGVTKCLNSDGTPSNPNSASAVAAASSSAAAANASAVADAQTIAAANGQNASGVAAAGATAAGILGAGGGPGGNGTSRDPVLNEFCKNNPNSKVCADEELGTVEDSTVTNNDVSVAITPVSIGSAGSCPAPTPFSIAGRTGYFNWTTYCNFATGIKPILLAFAWLSAAGILIGGFKE